MATEARLSGLRGPAGVGLALLSLSLAALAVRSYQLPWIFGPDGSVLIEPYDGSYHARLAYYSFARFPRALFFDPQISYPDGAVVPLPLLYDWCLGAVARLFGETQAVFERVAAWASPALAALTVLPVFAAGRAVAGTGVGLGAAAIFALLPAHGGFSQLGNPDHHAAVALLGSAFLALSLSALGPEPLRGRALRVLGLGLVRAGIVLSWTGSLLYVALGDGALLLAASVAGRRSVLADQSASALLSAALVAPWAAALGEPIGGLFSSTSFSWLPVVAILGVAAVAGAALLLERLRPAASPAARLLRLAAVGAAAALVLLLALRETVLPAAGFLTKSDAWVEGVPEQRALFAWLRNGDGSSEPGTATQLFGFFAFLIPLAPLAALWSERSRRTRGPGTCLAVWTAGFGFLAVSQIRFGCDFAPSGAVAFALLVAQVGGVVPGPGRRRDIARVALGLLLFSPVLSLHARNLWIAGSRAMNPQPGFEHPYGPLVAFAREIRRATPETSGFLDPKAVPEYGLLARPTYGHLLSYAARRATPTSNLGPYLDPRKMELVQEFLSQRDEARALEIAAELRGRYVMVGDNEVIEPGELEHHLYFHDGTERAGLPALGRFRLVTEGPPGEAGPAGLRRFARYKLFEIVPGAVLVVPGPPGERVVASVRVETPMGRPLAFRTSGPVGSDGFARVRVPYATAADAPLRALGPWRVRVAGRELGATVTERDVREGRSVEAAAL